MRSRCEGSKKATTVSATRRTARADFATGLIGRVGASPPARATPLDAHSVPMHIGSRSRQKVQSQVQKNQRTRPPPAR